MKRTTGFLTSMLTALFIAYTLSLSPSAVLAVENGGYVNPQLLVSTEWLAQHMNDPGVKILDRQDIDPPDDIYSKGHIPNSIRMPTSAIKGMKGDIKEMLILKDLVTFLGANGVTAADHIILAGNAARLPATSRVFWALEIIGHKKASILDGGIDKWKAENRPLTTEPAKVAAVTYKSAGLDRERFMAGDELLGYLGLFDELGIMVVDSRVPDEFKGLKMSRESDKLGHIPGATNLFFMAVLTGNFKEYAAAAEIEKVFKSKNITPDKNVVFTCVSGCFGTSLYSQFQFRYEPERQAVAGEFRPHVWTGG